MSCVVHAVRLGTIHDHRDGLVAGEPHVPMDIPVWAAAVEAGGRRILIDTGLDDAQRWAHLTGHTIEPGHTLDAGLAELGWRASDIDVVINTHLHYDHASNNFRFPDARFYVSRTEWEFAANPGAQVRIYAPEWGEETVDRGQYTLIDSDEYEVLPGVVLICTPGHTPGHQSVLLETADGTLCVTGDAACMLPNLTRPAPPGTTTSVPAAMASIERIRTVADRVLMNHDPDLASFQNTGFPLCPPAVGEDPRGPRPTIGERN
jgi:N-acyl homoserine lactone hydrolase